MLKRVKVRGPNGKGNCKKKGGGTLGHNGKEDREARKDIAHEHITTRGTSLPQNKGKKKGGHTRAGIRKKNLPSLIKSRGKGWGAKKEDLSNKVSTGSLDQ